jgi:hypothetical protein
MRLVVRVVSRCGGSLAPGSAAEGRSAYLHGSKTNQRPDNKEVNKGWSVVSFEKIIILYIILYYILLSIFTSIRQGIVYHDSYVFTLNSWHGLVAQQLT